MYIIMVKFQQKSEDGRGFIGVGWCGGGGVGTVVSVTTVVGSSCQHTERVNTPKRETFTETLLKSGGR